MRDVKADLIQATELKRFFSFIPDDRWCMGTIQDDKGNRCARGHYRARFGKRKEWEMGKLIGQVKADCDKGYWEDYYQGSYGLHILEMTNDIQPMGCPLDTPKARVVDLMDTVCQRLEYMVAEGISYPETKVPEIIGAAIYWTSLLPAKLTIIDDVTVAEPELSPASLEKLWKDEPAPAEAVVRRDTVMTVARPTGEAWEAIAKYWRAKANEWAGAGESSA